MSVAVGANRISFQGGKASWEVLRRYLKGKPRLVFCFPWQAVNTVDVYSDTGWAGCVKTRKRLPGGCVMLGEHLTKSWSSTQVSTSLSSGEAEFYDGVEASGAGFGYVTSRRCWGAPAIKGLDRQHRHSRDQRGTGGRKAASCGHAVPLDPAVC